MFQTFLSYQFDRGKVTSLLWAEVKDWSRANIALDLIYNGHLSSNSPIVKFTKKNITDST